MNIITAPNILETDKFSIFLAGSIEQDKAENWQDKLCRLLGSLDMTAFNPRRETWDASWVQRADNPQFAEQVNWELDALGMADCIVMYFDPKTLSPISLLELGLHAASGKMIVCCAEGFWRKGNVDIVCQRYGLPQFNDLEAIAKEVKKRYDRR